MSSVPRVAISSRCKGTAEGAAVPRSDNRIRLIDLAQEGITALCAIQAEALACAGVDLDALMIR